MVKVGGNEMVSAREAADFLECSTQAVKAYARTGKIKGQQRLVGNQKRWFLNWQSVNEAKASGLIHARHGKNGPVRHIEVAMPEAQEVTITIPRIRYEMISTALKSTRFPTIKAYLESEIDGLGTKLEKKIATLFEDAAGLMREDLKAPARQ